MVSFANRHCALFLFHRKDHADFMMDRPSFKQVFLFAFLFVAIISGCKKDNGGDSDGDGYYIKFKFDGTEIKFEETPFANFSVADDIYMGGFGAFKKTGVT